MLQTKEEEEQNLIEANDSLEMAMKSVTEISHPRGGTEEKKPAQKSSAAQAFINLLRGMVGTSFLTLPFLCQEIGSLQFLGTMLLVGFNTLYGMRLLIEIMEDMKYEGRSYPNIIALVFRKAWIKTVLNIMLAIMQLLSSVAGCLFICQVVEYILCVNKYQLCFHPTLIKCCLLLLSAPSFFIKTISTFSYVSVVSTISLCALVISLLVEGGVILGTQPRAPQLSPRWLLIPSAYAVGNYTLKGIGLIIPIKNSMEDQSKFNSLITYCTIIVTIIYITLAMLSSEAHGINTRTIILMNYSIGYPVIFVLMMVYSMCIFISFPLYLFPVYTIILNTGPSKKYLEAVHDDEIERSSRRRRVLLLSRVACMAIVYGIVLANPNFMAFLGLIGGIFCSSFGFFIPLVTHAFHFWKTISKPRLILNIFLGLVVLAATSIAVVESLMNITKANKHKAV